MAVISCPGDIAWFLGWLSKQKLNLSMLKHPSWKGFMKSIHNESGMEKLVIEFLPIMNAPFTLDSFSTMYTTIIECLKLSTDLPMMITFDLPLWSKATQIILDSNLPVIPRLELSPADELHLRNWLSHDRLGGLKSLQVNFLGFPVGKSLLGKSNEKNPPSTLPDKCIILYMPLGGCAVK